MSTEIEDESVDVVVTSVPYNIGVKYGTYKDSLPEFDYLEWLAGVFTEIRGVLKDEGSFFLNVGSNRRKPWTAMRVAEVAGQFFKLQNEIIWVKSIAVGGRSHGTFNPVNSQRYLHHNWEHVFHFSKSGKVALDRLAIGVPYEDKGNLIRFGATEDLRLIYVQGKAVLRNARRRQSAKLA
jgi:site-specific DNA-methyltransferase (adenine-specific)